MTKRVLLAVMAICLIIPFVSYIFITHDLITGLVLLVLAAVCLLVILCALVWYLFIERSNTRRIAVACMSVVMIALFITGWWSGTLSRWNDEIFFVMRKDRMETFMRDVNEYGGLQEIWWSGHASDSEAEVYEGFKRRLERMNFIGYEMVDGTAFFTIDGVVDNCWGIAYSRDGTYPSVNSCGRIVYWESIEGDWYRWSST